MFSQVSRRGTAKVRSSSTTRAPKGRRKPLLADLASKSKSSKQAFLRPRTLSLARLLLARVLSLMQKPSNFVHEVRLATSASGRGGKQDTARLFAVVL